MQATIEKNLIPVIHSTRNDLAPGPIEFLTINCPEGWDDVKKISNKILKYGEKHFKFTGWNSDRNECYFRETAGFAKIVK